MRYEAATSSPGPVTRLGILGAQKLHHFEVRALLLQVFFFAVAKKLGTMPQFHLRGMISKISCKCTGPTISYESLDSRVCGGSKIEKMLKIHFNQFRAVYTSVRL
jgi:hypothetical protein